jgi:putative nucleotidyltransferase with HDIG domain
MLDLEPLTDANRDAKSAALRAHCRRVAALSYELGLILGFTREQLADVREAAIRHHAAPLRHDEGSVRRLLNDLKLGTAGPEVVLPARVQELLTALDGPLSLRVSLDAPVRLAASVIELANLLDEALELAPLEGERLDRVLETVEQTAREQLYEPRLLEALKRLRKTSPKAIEALIPKLPVYPAIAIKAVSLVNKPRVSLVEFENLCRQDQVLAGQILEVANSARFGPRFPIATVSQAVNFIGLDQTRRLALAAAVKPLFANAKLQVLWKHSVECAEIAEYIAGLSQIVDTREAFVAGLLHDIGRLAYSLLPREVGEACERLTSAGCEPLMAELVITGFDHAQTGAQILGGWNVPSNLVDAVRYHHHPEDTPNPMASVLYLTEFWAASDEDLPSNRQLSAALDCLSISPELLDTANLARMGTLLNGLT